MFMASASCRSGCAVQPDIGGISSWRQVQQKNLTYAGGVVVVGQVAHFNLTPEASLCRGFNLLPFVLSKGWRAQMETCGQIACAVGRLPIRFTVGPGGTISVWAQATRSVFCRAESASVADSAEWVLAQRRGEPLEKDTSARERQSALRFFNSSEEQE